MKENDTEEQLRLSDEQLLVLEKPERYIGREVNSVRKNRDEVKLRFCFCFPDVYEIGMSHLGIQILYGLFNSWTDIWCERVYSPWMDADAMLRREQIPLFALESQDPVRDFDFLGFTLQYELCYTNILQVLDLSEIPLMAAQRTDWSMPIVIGGGPCTYNPEPIADFFDLFYIGEGETQYRRLFDLYIEYRVRGASRTEFLRACAQIPGIYVPSLYEIDYHADGTVAAIRTAGEDVPSVVHRDVVTDLTNAYYPLKPVVPFIRTAQDRAVLEILRGCIRGCRFCQAGDIYRPFRERDVEQLKKYAVELLRNTGYEEISLSSLSSSDYSSLNELLDFLIRECDRQKVNISLPSLRIDAFSLDVMGKVQDIKKSSLTFAPEAGSQRLRDVINKGLTTEDILNGARQAFLGGWNRVKLYFMLGLPTDTEEDIRGIAGIAEMLTELYFDTVPKEERHGRTIEIVASTSFFVPKPFTPFQWAAMNTKTQFMDKTHITREAIVAQHNQKHIRYNWHEVDASVLEGVLARGDRRLSGVILRAYRAGCIFDAWSESFYPERWQAAMDAEGLSADFYAHRERPEDEIFPWDMLDAGVSRGFLLREWQRARRGEVTPNCRQACQGCGAARFGTGICPGAGRKEES
ncbi:MAG: TIGR03960 family B12-binding radical SAM protein [Butyrivibrio sp.]|nr:TIGR03960 family B12-binding radical SAM protein [Butyrivibrio sp.]